MKNEKEVKQVFIDLAKENLFISNESDNKMSLRDCDGNILFVFELSKDISTLTCLKIAVDDLKLKIDRAFRKNWI